MSLYMTAAYLIADKLQAQLLISGEGESLGQIEIGCYRVIVGDFFARSGAPKQFCVNRAIASQSLS